MAMEVYQENQLALVVSSPAASPPTSLQELLDAQKQLIGSHIDHLKSIVNRQCKLTGINPLSQEMAAGALSIKIGKRPRDLLNPKAIKYMQLIFSVKDAISKKESREISALFGVTATQVREFFTSQRTRVRRFVRLSRDKAVRSTSSKEAEDGPSCSDSSVPIHPVPLNFVGPTCTEGPSCSTQDEILSCIDDYDKHFVGSIFNMMRTEETFSGQVKLLEWILQTQNSLVLQWFLTKGGVMILASWLGEAASEEQTSVLHVILQVLCHLPLNKAIPAHMSAILQSVNKLRFYQTSDISSRAKILLGRWSKMFARTQAMRKPGSTMSSGDSQDEILLKQSIGEIMGNESWESKIDMDGTLIPLSEASVDSRNMGTSQPMKLLMAPTDESNKKLLRGGSSSQTRERRKVQMVEQPGQKGAGRSPQVARSVLATQGRPLSADDIQKAKMRAQFMQHKYGKIITSASNESSLLKIEGSSSYSSSQASNSISASKAFIQPEVDELMKPVKVLPRVVSNQSKATLQNKVTPVSEEPLLKKCKMMQIPWLTPPEFRISTAWSVGTGENSKEVEIQKNRIRREKEIVYKTAQEIPSNPKDPWDQEMDYDDTLTPEVPIDQLPDDSMDTGVSLPLPEKSQEIAVGSNGSVSEPPAQNSNPMKMPEPDLELLAVLLKNPEVVFALTSGQGGNLSGEQMVRLLDMIKSNGVNSVSSLITGIVDKKAEEERVEVSLPSPTPSSNPVTSGWRAEIAKNPFSRGSITVNGEAYTIPRVSVQEMLPASSLAMPQNGLVVAAAHPQQHALYSGAISSPNVQLQQLRPSNATSLSMKNLPVPIPSWPTPLPGDSLLPNHSHHQTQPHAHQTLISEPTYLSSSHSWRGRQGGMEPNAYGQANQSSNTYGVDRVGLMQAPLHSGGWERNEYRGERGFGYNSSGANSPTRYQEHMLEWNYPEPPSRMSSGRSDYRLPPEIARPRNPNGYHERDKNSRWRDRRR